MKKKFPKWLRYSLITICILFVFFFFYVIYTVTTDDTTTLDFARISGVKKDDISVFYSDDSGKYRFSHSKENYDELAEKKNAIKGVTAFGTDFISFRKKSSTVSYFKKGNDLIEITGDSDKDAAKVTSVVDALFFKEGYRRGEKDYSEKAQTYVFENEKCIFVLPAQLSRIEEKQTGTVIFSDTKSDTRITVKTENNPYSSITSFEEIFKEKEYNTVLSVGNDFYTAEVKDAKKKTVTYTLCGFGNNFILTAELEYSETNSYIFDELRSLMKFSFYGSGIWKTDSVASDYIFPSTDIEAQRESSSSFTQSAVFIEEFDSYFSYPDIFSVTAENNGEYIFTDPATGAYIKVYSDTGDDASNLKKVSDRLKHSYEYVKIESNDKIVFSDRTNFDENRYGIFNQTKDKASLICVEIIYNKDYYDIYSQAEKSISLITSGNEIYTDEVEYNYIKSCGCIFSLPVQFTETKSSGDSLTMTDSFTGIICTVECTKSDGYSDNLFDVFNVTAPDSDVYLTQSCIYWHENGDIFIGCAGRKYNALMTFHGKGAEELFEELVDLTELSFNQNEKAEYHSAEVMEKVIEYYKEKSSGDDTTAAMAVDNDTPEFSREKTNGYNEIENTPIKSICEISEPAVIAYGDCNIVEFSKLNEEQFTSLSDYAASLSDVSGFEKASLTSAAYADDGELCYSYKYKLSEYDQTMYVIFTFNSEADYLLVYYFYSEPLTEIVSSDIIWDDENRLDSYSVYAQAYSVKCAYEMASEYVESVTDGYGDYVYRIEALTVCDDDNIYESESFPLYSSAYDNTKGYFKILGISYGTYDNGEFTPEGSFAYIDKTGYLFRIEDAKATLIPIDFFY